MLCCRAVIDIRLLREKPEEVRAAYERLGATVDLDGVAAADARVRDLKNESQTLQAEQNRLSKEIGRAAPGEAREKAKAASTALKEKIERLNTELVAAEAALDTVLLQLPNLPDPSVPVGKDDAENRVVREVGDKRSFDFTPKPHWDLGTALGIIDFERGVKISGIALLRAQGRGRAAAARAHRLDARRAHRAAGYTEIYPPYMVKRECLVGTGNLPKFGDNLYRDAEEDFWFIPTAEVPVTNMYRDEVLDGAQLPIKHVAYTACFRREKMAHGRDTRGIKRGHQFDKVEMVKFVRPETSMAELDGLLADAEDILKALELPYRVVADVHRRSVVLGVAKYRPGAVGARLRRVAGGQLLLQLRRLPGAAREIRFQGGGKDKAALRAHAQRLGPGAAADADRRARDLPARRRAHRRPGGAAAVSGRRRNPRIVVGRG